MKTIAAAFALLLLATTAAFAQGADMILVNGKIATLDAKNSIQQSLAIQAGKIEAVGSNDEIRLLAGPSTKIVDLQGRTVIPGLIDSHMHAIRAALSFATEVNWIGTHSIPEAMARLSAAAKSKPPGAWLIVAGGWTEQQFAERRRPTQAEIEAAAPGSPIYIQLFYGSALLSHAALDKLAIKAEADVPPKGKFARDGWIEGDLATISALFDRLPTANAAEQVAGTKQFFRELNRLGMTGVIDPGGFNITAASYRALFQVWEARQMTIRVRYSDFAQRPGHELEDYKSALQLLPMGFGDDMLRTNGIGELVTVGIYNNDHPSDEVKQQFYEVAKWAAENHLALTIHWPNDAAAGQLLDIFQRIDSEVGMKNLRWSVAHLNDASDATLRRMKALNVGWTMQDAMYFSGEGFLKARGPDQIKRTPPIVTAEKIGVHIGGGTDAHRVASYNPFVSLQWMLDGKTVAGMPTRDASEIPTRMDALRLYTQGSAWFSFEDQTRGTLQKGRLADLAVLTRDYFTVPVDKIGGLESQLTLVGGRPVYAVGPFAGLQDKTVAGR